MLSAFKRIFLWKDVQFNLKKDPLLNSLKTQQALKDNFYRVLEKSFRFVNASDGAKHLPKEKQISNFNIVI